MKQIENERHQLAEAFVSLVEGEQQSHTKNQEQAMMSVLFASYDKGSAQAISFLLHHVTTDVVRQFSYNHLYFSDQEFWYGERFSFMSVPKAFQQSGNHVIK